VFLGGGGSMASQEWHISMSMAGDAGGAGDGATMHKTLLSTSALRILPLRWPRAACGKLRNSCGHVV